MSLGGESGRRRRPGGAVSAAPHRPVLRWHGGKWRLAPWIIGYFPAHEIYVEPYGGAASVLLRKVRARHEVYGDLDGDVVNLFAVLRGTEAGDLIRQIALTPFSRAEFDRAYAPCQDPVERARRLLIRSHQGFGSNGHARKTGFRFRGIRAGSLPQHNWVGLPDVLRAVVERLGGVVVESRPALDVIAAQDGPETLFYVDPPYVPETRDAGGDYAHEMTPGDHAALLDKLNRVAGMVALSGYRCALYDAALAGWRREDHSAMADGAMARVETLWLNPALSARTPQGALL